MGRLLFTKSNAFYTTGLPVEILEKIIGYLSPKEQHEFSTINDKCRGVVLSQYCNITMSAHDIGCLKYLNRMKHITFYRSNTCKSPNTCMLFITRLSQMVQESRLPCLRHVVFSDFLFSIDHVKMIVNIFGDISSLCFSQCHPISYDSFECLVNSTINTICASPYEDDKERWASLINESRGKKWFGINLLEIIPPALLDHHYLSYYNR